MPEKTVTRIDFPSKPVIQKAATPNKRVAAYARVSTAKDAQENSLKSQQEYYERYIKRHPGWDFAGVYADDGVSGLSIRNRESFGRMIQDALDGKIDMVITKSLSRFARNTVDSLMTIRKLKAVGVAVLFEKEGINTLDANGEFLITLMSSFAEEESRSISENVKWAVHRRFARGQYSFPFRVFLGYRRGENGKIIIDENEARVVRYIYWLACQGLGSTLICDLLEKRGLRSPGGSSSWTSNTVRSILQNEKYMGNARLQKTVVTDFLTKTQKVNEGEEPQYYVENGHPAIISKPIWHEVQEKWCRTIGRKTTLDPLFGKIRCGDCGGKYGRKVWHSTTYHDVVWQCNRKKSGETKCRCKHIYDRELRIATEMALSRLLSRYSDVVSDCTELLHGNISNPDTKECHLNSELPGDILFDDVAMRTLITGVKITAGGYAVFAFLDGSSCRYRFKAPTPKGVVGMHQRERNHMRILEMHERGVSAKSIAHELGISVNTVRSYLRRHKDIALNEMQNY